jgi:acetyltransferase-like isoleucine patch superfamily enzyme
VVFAPIYISNKVYLDISGGRFPDSNFITGRGCLIAYESYINVSRQVKIGENVALSPKSMIYTHSYWQSLLDGYPATFGPVSIDDNAWLGSVAQVLPNITVGTGSIIISNSLVSGNVKPYTMVGGVPAKIIKENLKKNISETNKEKIIEGLFPELGDWLYSHHFDIERINNKKMNISKGSEKKSCLLLEKKLFDKQDKIDIVIAYKFNETEIGSFKTLFDIHNNIVIGPVETVEKMIIEFFRRRGIRFYGT